MHPLPSAEAKRLSSSENDWNLVGGSRILSRTRGGSGVLGQQANAEIARMESDDVPEVVETNDSSVATTPTREGSETGGEDSSAVTAESPPVAATKPTHTRVILEVAQLEQAFKGFTCPECEGELALKLRTVCIASNIELVCHNKNCSYVCDFARPSPTTLHIDERVKNYERMTDYAVNILYVLGFISVGDGHTEAGRLLGLLGLPNDTTMMNRSFGIIEDRVGPYIRKLCDEIIRDNLEEEARLSMNEVDYNIWKMWLSNDTLGPMPVERMPHLDASYDMAWQQKGSGHQYNSQSGHGSLFGRYSRKIIGLVIKSKLCCVCTSWRRKHPNEEDLVPDHRCWKNHDGSSGSMESSGAVQVIVEAFEKHKVVIKRLCCDDDSSIRADCQWSNADYLKNNNTDVLPKVPITKGKNQGKLQDRADKGKLPPHVPEPIFVADPNHRRKGLTGELIKLDMSKVDVKMTMTRMDSTRIGKNFGYMARTLKQRPEAEFVDAAKACLEHHFDNHIYCGDWCKRKDNTEDQRKGSIKYYRCKEKDAKLYALLVDKMSRFITQERLNEMAHTLDTNMNEAFNQICTWFAPKNKVYSGTGSLPNRIAFAVGINSVGLEVFFKRLFKMMGITVSSNVAYYLHNKEKTRVKRLAKVKTKDAKLKKNKRKYDKLAEDTLVAKKEQHRREGTYRKGMNLDEVVDSTDNPIAKVARKTAAKYCEFCGAKGHLTKRSAKCTARESVVIRFNKEDGSVLANSNLPVGAMIEPGNLDAAANLARDDCDNMDSLPFDADYDSELDVPPPFFDEEDSDDEQDGLARGVL
jgi:hypothetical protein